MELKDKKIYHLLPNELDALKELLRYIIVILGIKPENVPTPDEFTALINFIRRNFKFTTLSQISEAFEAQVMGKHGIKHNSHLSARFFSEVMTAYISKQKRDNNFQIERKITDEEKNKIRDEYFKNIILPIYYDYKKTGEIKITSTTPLVILLTLKNMGLYKITKEDKAFAANIAKQKFKDYKNNFTPKNFGEFKTMNDLLTEPIETNDKFKRLANLELVKLAFKKLKNETKY